MAEKVEILTQKEFAARVGVSGPRVNQLARKGRLPLASDGKKIIWPAARDVWIAEHLGVERSPNQKPESEAPSVDSQIARQQTTIDGASSSAAIAAQLAKARAADKTFQAQTRGLKYEALKGTLVARADVDADSANVGTLIRTTLLGLPSKLAPLLSGRVLETAEVEKLLADEIEYALKYLHGARFRAPKETT